MCWSNCVLPNVTHMAKIRNTDEDRTGLANMAEEHARTVNTCPATKPEETH